MKKNKNLAPMPSEQLGVKHLILTIGGKKIVISNDEKDENMVKFEVEYDDGSVGGGYAFGKLLIGDFITAHNSHGFTSRQGEKIFL